MAKTRDKFYSETDKKTTSEACSCGCLMVGYDSGCLSLLVEGTVGTGYLGLLSRCQCKRISVEECRLHYLNSAQQIYEGFE